MDVLVQYKIDTSLLPNAVDPNDVDKKNNIIIKKRIFQCNVSEVMPAVSQVLVDQVRC